MEEKFSDKNSLETKGENDFNIMIKLKKMYDFPNNSRLLKCNLSD